MKNILFTIALLVSSVSFGQTAIYSSNGVLTIETPEFQDVLLGYPTVDMLNSKAIDNYNKGTEILYSLNKASTNIKRINLINQAIDYFIISINFDSKFVQAYDNIGKAYRMLKKHDLAIISYEMSLKIFPKGVSAHQNLGVIYVEQKNWDKAIKEYKILIKLSPENAEGYYGLANIYQRTSKLKLALSKALIALNLYEKNPTNYIGDSYAQIGLIYYYMGHKLKAKKYIQIAKDKYISNNLEPYFYSTFPKNMIKELAIN
tara:strand:- start:155 stop:934 length:780 start_codon:yes stop_codon:yes gene_type:complete